MSEMLFNRAMQVIPGGVNSPVRAFKNVGLTPKFIDRADGAYIYDVEGNKYTDYVGSWGPMILGHNHPEIKKAVIEMAEKGLSFGAATEIEIEMAELICSIIPSLDMVRMVSSGTEAVMSAIRLARGYTKRDKLVKFEGCYHGHSDSMLVKAGSGVMTAGVPDSAGVPEGCAKDTLTAVYNDIESVKTLFSENKGEIAAVIIEPIAANMGVVLPKEGFLKELRKLCSENGSLLIFDEVITGFRLSVGGASVYYDIQPDIITFGKIIGGGMPVGAYGGKKEIMQCISPLGTVYQAGTLSGNPIAMAAGLTQLKLLKNNPEIYEKISCLGTKLADGLREISYGKGCVVNNIASLSCIFFTEQKVENYRDAKKSDTERYAKYFAHMLQNGVYLAPAQFEAAFISNAHCESDIDKTLKTAKEFFSK